ncbi:MAG TPA: YceI family protein [Nevskiaceae bacterium]|nr:YceI family protein [Nevskiaceae bacterium]
MSRLGLLVLLLMLGACAQQPLTPAPAGAAVTAPAPEQWLQTLPADQRYRLDPDRSRLRLYVFRGGAMARLGHNHVLQPRQWQAALHLPDPARPASARFEIALPLAQLAIDDPAWRAETGAAFAGERTAEEIRGTQTNLLKPFAPDPDPQLRLSATAVHGDWPQLVAELRVILAGVSREMAVPLTVTREAGGYRVQGRLALRQSDFGLSPFSVLGGALAVQDWVSAEFDLQLQPG